ncbi:MAG: VOC family protein [Candidatus Eremiobacteraeota bacterium]|nr:VOC family protein [Candidatus Eremiobacteraeota bacterium]
MSSSSLSILCDHLDIRVRHAEAARAFYDPFCAALGLTVIDVLPKWITYERPCPASCFLAIESEPNFIASASRIAFRAGSREEVERIADVARRAGATDFEPPQLCTEYSAGYYASFFSDPDGNRYEVCYRPAAHRA